MPPPPLPAGAGLPPPPPAQYVISRYNGFIALQSVFVGLATASVLARLYVRSIVIKNLGLDELFVIFAFVEWSYLSWLVNDLHNQILSITTLAITVIMTHQRVDFVRQHPQMSNNILPGLKWQEISQPLTILSIMFTRVSICFFLLRIVGIGQSWKTRTWKWGLYSIMGLALITGIPVALITVLQCSPVEKLWSPMMAGTCWDPDITIAIGEFHGAVAVLLDWSLATLPIIFMWNVQMAFRLKAGICALMSMGYFTGICAIVKTICLKGVADGNLTDDLIDLGNWSILEVNVGILAACIPTLRPLFSRAIRESRGARGRYKVSWSINSNPKSSNSSKPPPIHLEDKERLHNVELNAMSPSLRDESHDRGMTIPIKMSEDGIAYAREEEVAFDRV